MDAVARMKLLPLTIRDLPQRLQCRWLANDKFVVSYRLRELRLQMARPASGSALIWAENQRHRLQKMVAL